MPVKNHNICSGVSALLVQVARINRVEGDKVLEQFGLHSGQELLLGTLWQTDGLRPADAASRLGVTPAAVTKHVGRLTERGLVETRASETDGRSIRIYLTKRGRDLRQKIGDSIVTLERRLLDALSAKEQAQLHALLLKMLANLNVRS
jgi:MarR family transcriptional regulator, organic hydroperoxide resistance regulator